MAQVKNYPYDEAGEVIERQARMGAYVVAVLVFGGFTVALAHTIRKMRVKITTLFALVGLSLVYVVFFTPLVYASDIRAVITGKSLWEVVLLDWWVMTLPLSPAVAVGLSGWDLVVHMLRRKTLSEQIEQKRLEYDEKNRQLSREAQKEAGHPPESRHGYIRPGVFVKGDKVPQSYGIYRDNHNWVLIEERLLDQHFLIVGGTGMGKSVLLSRLVAEIVRATDRDIFLVDGKGEEAFAIDIATILYAATGKPVPWFRMGTPSGLGAQYDGLRGDKFAVFNRLAALCGIQLAAGHAGAEYYAEGSRTLLQLGCLLNVPYGEPPRSFAEVRERLNRDWLKSAYRDIPHELQAIEEIPYQIYSGLAMRVRSLEREFGQVLAPSGFALEEHHAAIFSIRAQSVGISASRLLNFIIEDFKDFAGNRQKRPAVLIIDEFGVFDNENIRNLLALARSARLGVILATQDVATLGEEQNSKLIMANTMTKVLMGTLHPEEIASLGGTIQALEASIQHKEGDPTGMGSARVQEQFRISPNEVREMAAGEAFLIRQNRAIKLAVAKPSYLPPDKRAVVLTGRGETPKRVTVVSTDDENRQLPPPPKELDTGVIDLDL